MRKRQGSIASSKYAAKFLSLYTATDEAQSLQYMISYLGYNVPYDELYPTRIFGDNLSVILNAQNPVTDLFKKHAVIYIYAVIKAVAAGIIESYWLKGEFSTSKIMTKKIPHTEFKEHVDYIYWHPDFHIHSENRLDESHMDTS